MLVGKNNRQENEKKDGRPASRTEIKDDGQQQELSDMFMTAPQDYKIDMAVFDAAQAHWGECTIDAFAAQLPICSHDTGPRKGARRRSMWARSVTR